MKGLKYSMKQGQFLALIGLCIILFGALNNHLLIRMAGTLVTTAGLTAWGKRLYEAWKEKQHAKKKVQVL